MKGYPTISPVGIGDLYFILIYILLLFMCFSWFPEENYPKLTFNQLVKNQDRIDRLEQDQPL